MIATKKNFIPSGAWVLACDHHQDIVFGRLVEHDRVLQTVDLEEAQIVWEYHVDGPGLGALAVRGPRAGSTTKIDLAVPRHTVADVASVLECTPEAAESIRAWKTT